MRPSQRHAVLDAALELVASAEGADITLESVARRAGLSKPGLMYHFPNREALLLAIVEHAASRFDAALLNALGKPFESATTVDRYRAYVQVAAGSEVDRAEYAVYVQASYRPALTRPWVDCVGRWLDIPARTPAGLRARLTTARLAADGLWAANATNVFAPSVRDRDAIAAVLADLTSADEGAS